MSMARTVQAAGLQRGNGPTPNPSATHALMIVAKS
jgi:hypothetical protein